MAEQDVQAEAAGGETAFGSSEFENLLQKEFRPKSDQAKTAVESAVKTLAEQALSNTALISDDALRSIEGIVAEIDKKLTEQVNLILHHEDFQQMESAWRGLHYLVNNTESDENLKIRDEHRQKGNAQDSAQVQRDRVGSIADLQEALYRRVQPVGW